MLDVETPQPIVWLVLAWLFALGGCIGSFMNVVIYRLPAGLSLLYPPSRCPNCETPIRASDNVPIFGWLWLRGRCRSCRAAIPLRYPAVELLVALLFVSLAWVEPLSGGKNLPLPPSGLSLAELWGIYAFHLFLVCSLICAAFTELDGNRLTWRLVLPSMVIGLFAPLIWPHLHPTTTPLAPLDSLVDGLLGAATGGLAGYVISWPARMMNHGASATTKRTREPRRPQHAQGDAAAALAWTGAFLGWPAAIALAAASGGTFWLLRIISRLMPTTGRLGLLSQLAFWTLIWIALWRQLQAMLP